MSIYSVSSVRDILGSTPSGDVLKEYIVHLRTIAGTPPESVIPEIKSYSDAVYFNYFSLGISLSFSPQAGYKPIKGLELRDLKCDALILDSIDLYNVPKISRPGAPTTKSTPVDSPFSSFPLTSSPLSLYLNAAYTPEPSKPRPEKLDVTADTTGKDFVACFGEPGRKGGGAGPSSGSIGIWCEWVADGVMVEFGGDESRGPQAWEKGKDAVWKVITIFPPKLS